MALKNINILGKKYKVKTFTSNNSEDNSKYFGLCQDDIATIYLANDLREGEEFWTTLFHEIGHASMYRNGMRFTGALPPEMEEIIVETFSQVQYSFTKHILKEMVKGASLVEVKKRVESFCKDTVEKGKKCPLK
jgi:hypothetical protein